MTGTEQISDKGEQPDLAAAGVLDDGLKDEATEDAELWAEFDKAEADAVDAAAADTSAAVEAKATANAKTDDDAAGDGKGKPDGSGGKPPDNEAADVLWANASPEQKAAYEAAQAQIKKLDQSDRSQRGRLAAMQRQVHELSEKLSSGKPAAAPAAAGDKGKAGDEPQGALATKDWKSFEQEYPEVAKPVASLIAGMQADLTRQRKELDAIGTDRREAALNEQAELLEAEHADWQEVVAAEGFVEWLDAQPRHIREAAVRNAAEIVDAAEAADVVGRFKATRSADGGGQSLNTDTPAKGNGTTRLTGKRQRQLETASTARGGGPGTALGIPEDGDPEAIWKAFDKLEQRQAQRA